ncbi:MAG: hypothetical protein LBI63_02890, partial [Candidatus Ancillula sp.]|nr:hypothetical protein [Candidatus Ancillula sp.]
MTLRKPVLLLFTLVLVLSFSSCTKDKQESEPYSGNTESSSSTQTSDAVKDQKNQDNNNWVEFFARYFNEGTNGWFDLQLKAENLHKEKCMKEKGFTLELPKTDDDIKLENDGFPFKGRIVADETWGVTDPEYARVY